MKTKTVLYVEDEEHDAFFMQWAFKKAQVANLLQIVVDGQQAVAYLQGTGAFANREQYPLPSLVLLDLNIPCLSGIEVLQWLRKDPELHDLPVVIFSSSSNLLDIAKTKELGIQHYLVKPHDPQEIVMQLEELISSGLLLAL